VPFAPLAAGPAVSTDRGSFTSRGSTRVVTANRVSAKTDTNAAFVRSARPCNLLQGRLSIRRFLRRESNYAISQYLITASPVVGLVVEDYPVIVQLQNQVEALIDLGDLAAGNPAGVFVYELVLGRGWKRLGYVSLRVPC